jgi:hypothetical protein
MNVNATEFRPQEMQDLHPTHPRAFHFFSQLQEELVVNILSFLANVPFEKSSVGEPH